MKDLFVLPSQLNIESDERQDCIVAPQVVENVEVALQSFRVTPWDKMNWTSI